MRAEKVLVVVQSPEAVITTAREEGMTSRHRGQTEANYHHLLWIMGNCLMGYRINGWSWIDYSRVSVGLFFLDKRY